MLSRQGGAIADHHPQQVEQQQKGEADQEAAQAENGLRRERRRQRGKHRCQVRIKLEIGPAVGQQLLHIGQDHAHQVCRYLVKDFGTSQSPKSTRQRDSRYCPD
ncbi:MAG: hypothetical protein G8D58_12635, partial [gamma proteobacterium symbiont of Phacoides pectinatus]